jgi:hypothetical protein
VSEEKQLETKWRRRIRRRRRRRSRDQVEKKELGTRLWRRRRWRS